ncbi:TPA: hypothetical protein VAK76_004944 [Pseudomonas aeruginosa]|nr:hypothetical protein [Pseudomonas aeruginosa]MBH3637933.1 hypothetical protein [Pseudomonas aeruginosa]HEO1600507.1 hypothetical protein [Pseudomonas aeruginosa]
MLPDTLSLFPFRGISTGLLICRPDKPIDERKPALRGLRRFWSSHAYH